MKKLNYGSTYTPGSAMINPSTRPHFLCHICKVAVWREGGYATAGIHHNEHHDPQQHVSFDVQARIPQVYDHRPRNFSNYGHERKPYDKHVTRSV